MSSTSSLFLTRHRTLIGLLAGGAVVALTGAIFASTGQFAVAAAVPIAALLSSLWTAAGLHHASAAPSAPIAPPDLALQKAHDALAARLTELTQQSQAEREEHTRVETALKTSEAFFQSLVDNLPVNVFRRDTTGRFTFANRFLCERHHWSPGEIVGKTDHDLFPPEVAERRHEDLLKLVRTREPIIRVEVEILPDGSRRWIHLVKVAVMDAADRVIGVQGMFLDVTDLKRAQEEAAREQARFKFIFDSLPVGITWMRSGDLPSRIANPASARITGVPVERCSELHRYREASHPDDRARQDDLHRRLLANEFDHYTLEKRYVQADGSISWAELTVRFFRDPATGETQELSAYVDLTERKRAEARLAETSELLEAMLENSPDYIYFKDRSSRFVRFSQAFLARTKLGGTDTLVGKTDFDLFTEEHARPAYEDEQAIIRTGVPIVGKLEKESYPDGRVTWALTTKMPWRDAAGAIVGTFGISKDITAFKETETKLAAEHDKLRALLDASPDTIYFKDLQSRFVLVSRSKVRKTLIRVPELRTRRPDVPETELLDGLSDFDTFHDDDARQAYEDEQRIIRTGEPIVGKLEKQTYLNGGVRWNLSSKMPWRDGAGVIVGTFGISKDITELKEAEIKLEQMHRQLLDVSRQAGMAEVATGVLHNVGNVLNSVNVSATLVSDQVRDSKAGNLGKVAAMLHEHAGQLGDFLTRDPKGQRIPAYLATLALELAAERKVIVEELGHLRKNIAHIKDIVAMQQGYARVSGVPETVALCEIVEDALQINASALVRHGLEVVRDYRARPVLTLERHKVMQVLVNLIRNAKHACDDSARTDKQVIVRVTQEGDRVAVAVLDNGVGIPVENLTRIFAHGFTTRKEGHGFGLHSGALAAKELGGTLTAQSNGLGQGAVFTLELPTTPPTSPAPLAPPL